MLRESVRTCVRSIDRGILLNIVWREEYTLTRYLGGSCCSDVVGDESASWHREITFAFMSVVWSYFSLFGGRDQLVSFSNAGANVCIFCA